MVNKAILSPRSLRGALAFLSWPLVCLAAGLLLWAAVERQIAAERRAFENTIISDAVAMAGGYAQYLTRSIEQMDQVTMHIKYDWEKSHGTLRLSDLSVRGLFTAPQFVRVSIADGSGRIVSSTVKQELGASIADRGYFLQHRNDISSALHIDAPETDGLSGQDVIRFTRRLDTHEEQFDGIVIVSVEPDYFTTFYDGAGVGTAGLLAVIGDDRGLRTSRIGAATYRIDNPALRGVPAFGRRGAGSVAPSGERWFDGSWFADHERRLLAWQTLSAYPLTVMVGLSERERLQPYVRGWDTYRRAATWGCVALCMLAAIAAAVARRLEHKRRQARSVQAAYRLATESGEEGFFMLHPITGPDDHIVDFEIMDCNERGANLFGTTKAGLLGRRLSANYSFGDFERLLTVYRHAMEVGSYREEVQYPSNTGGIKWMRRKLVRSGDELAVTLRDITEAKAQERELIRLANTDELTGLPNRAWLTKFLSSALERTEQGEAALAVLFIDLDNFKSVNDAFGHSAGDALLREAANRLQATLRPTDHVARLGGDEFTVVLHPLSSEADARRVAERIIEALCRPYQIAGGINHVGASVGISLYPRDGDTAETLLMHADIAMYAAKTNAKGEYSFYRQELYESLKARVNTERELVEAIEVDQFELYFQPRIHAAGGRLSSLEALVRWRHPQRGIVPPLEFIPLAESTGLIVKLGALVIEKACRQLAQWRADGLPAVTVSINVSAVQFHQGDVYGTLASCLDRFRIAPDAIELEITESAMLGDHAGIADKLAAIRRLGVKLAVDDFGTGYSSLSQLQLLDMDVLKIDRVFTAELGIKAESEVLFRAIVSMAHALGMRVVAEGVETQAQAALLQGLGCDELQGYLIARPMPADAIGEFVKTAGGSRIATAGVPLAGGAIVGAVAA